MQDRRLISLVVVLTFLWGAAVAGAATPSTTRVSVSSTGAESDVLKGSIAGSISADGRFVVFISATTNFAAGDTNGQRDVFLRDRKTGETKRIDLSNAGAQSDGATLETARISADGRYVAFVSDATTLDPGGAAGVPRLYRYDRVAGRLELVPLPAGASSVAGTVPALAWWPSISISADGSRIAFRAVAAGIPQIWWWDAATGQVRRASESAAGVAGDGTGSFDAAISGNGRFVGFTSGSKNLGGPANPSYRDVFVKNLDSGAVDRISDVFGAVDPNANLHSALPALSFDGCMAAFFSDATNLVAGDTAAPHPKVFVRDRCGGSGTEIASLIGANSETKIQSAAPIAISDNGCRIVFLQASGSSAQMRDRCKGQTTRLDLSTAGLASPGGLRDLSISGGTGRYVTFTTTADTLVPGDSNAAPDVFVRDLADNTAPVAALKTLVSGNQVTVDGSASHDPDGYTLTGSINWGDGTTDPGLTGIHTYARSGTFGVTITVTDADGLPDVEIAVVSVGEPPPVVPGSGGPGGAGGGSSSDPVQLILDRVALTRSRFTVGTRAGTSLRLRLNLPATVTLTFDRARPGRRVKGKCRRGARRGARCTLYTRDGVITRTLPAGSSSVAITGLLGTRKLAAGSHRLTVQARAGGRATASKRLTFTVSKSKKKKKRRG